MESEKRKYARFFWSYFFIVSSFFCSHVNGKDESLKEEEEEEEEEEESVVEAKIEIKPKAMNASRWKWEVTDD
jgi:hypothetical protein